MAEKAWDDLSPSYRSRLLGATRSGKLTGTPVPAADAERVARQYRAAGGDLRSALGRAPRVLARGAAPKVATQRVARGIGTESDDRALGRWRRSRSAPKWIPVDPAVIGNDTAAILSQIIQVPSEWNQVNFAEQSDGSFLMTVISRDRTKQTVTLQDRNQVSEVATLLNETSRRGMAANEKEKKRLDDQWRRGKRRRSLKVNISYGRAGAAVGPSATAAPGEAPVPKTAEELFGQSVGPAFQSSGGAAPRPAASRSANRKKNEPNKSTQKKTTNKNQPAKKKPAPAKKSTARRRAPARPLGILEDVIATINEAVQVGELDTETAVNAIQAQIDALQKQIDRLQGR